jgi:hypothetical protein
MVSLTLYSLEKELQSSSARVHITHIHIYIYPTTIVHFPSLLKTNYRNIKIKNGEGKIFTLDEYRNTYKPNEAITLSLVVPAYNEEKRLSVMLDDALAVIISSITPICAISTKIIS